jgi:hypothetical protein
LNDVYLIALKLKPGCAEAKSSRAAWQQHSDLYNIIGSRLNYNHMENSQSYMGHRPLGQTATIMASPSKIIVIQPIRTTTEDDEPQPDSPAQELDPAWAEAANIRVSNRSSKTNIIFQCGEEDYREEELQSSIRKMYTNMKAQ